MADPKSLCAACSKPHQQACGRCHCIWYCSKECQTADWPTHKLLCRAYSQFDFTTRPSSEYFLGILFSPDLAKPQLIWVHFTWKCGYPYADSSPHLGTDVVSAPDVMIQRNEVLDRIITGRIRFQYRDSFLSDGSKLNRAIVALSNESARVRYDWRGPIMAFGMGGHGLDQRICRDLNPVDFRHLVDYFRTYTIDSDDEEDSDETENEYGEPKTSRLSKKVMGVKINCEGDQKVFGAPPFEEVEVPLLHPIFHNHDTSDIAALLELPILTAKYPPNKAWVEASPEDLRTRFECYYPFVNQAATFLHLTATKAAKDDPKSTWGWAPMRWQSKVGSVLVVRQDRKPLLPLHAEALSKYCQFHASRLFAHSMGEFEPEKPMTRDEVHATIKRPMFVVYYEKFRDDKQEKELDKGTILPIETPYDM